MRTRSFGILGPFFAFLCVMFTLAHAQQFFVIPGFPPAPSQSAQLWGGGFVVGQDNLSPNAHFFRTDSFGAYLVGNDGKMHQVITSATFSTAACDSATGFTIPGSCFGFYPTTGTTQAYQGVGGGVMEICASPAPGGAQTAFMYFGGYVFKSTDIDPTHPDGEHWHNTRELSGGGFTKTADTSNTNARWNGRNIACDPNNADHILVGTFSVGLWESKDGGSTFAQISSSDVPTSNAQGYKIAFDPSSGVNGSGLTNNVYVFSEGKGLYASIAGGGTGTWSQVSGTSTATFTGAGSTPSFNLTVTSVTGTIGINNTITGTGVPVGTLITSQTSGTTGGAGVYVTNNPIPLASASITSFVGPVTMQHMVVQACSPSPCTSNVLVADGTSTAAPSSGNALGYSGGTGGAWSLLADSCCHSITVNPLNTMQVAGVSGTAQIATSSTGGGAGSFSALLNYTFVPGDSPWQATIATNLSGATSGDIAFDQSVNGKLWCDCGQGIFTTTFPTSSFVYTPNVAGVMQPIGGFLLSPKAGYVITGMQDLGVCTSNIASLPPQTCFPLNQGKSLTNTGGLAQSSNFTWMKTSAGAFSSLADWSGYSSDFFQTDYHPLNSWTSRIVATSLSDNGSGKVHVDLTGTSFTTTGLANWSAGPPQTGDIICSYATVFVTGNAFAFGPQQNSCYSISNVTLLGFDFPNVAYTSLLHDLKAPDGITPGQYVFYRPTPPLSNFSGAFNIIGTASGAGGAIQVTYLYPSTNALVNGMPVWISGVLGTTEANGVWTIANLTTSIGNATFTLVGSTYTNAYTGGGVATSFEEPGGNIAAASDSNIVISPANAGDPQCSMDGGKTWTSNLNPLVTTNTAVTTVTGGPYTTGATSITVADTSQLKGANSTNMRIVMDDGRLFFDLPITVTPSSGAGTVTFHTGSTMTGATISNGSGGVGNTLTFTSTVGAVAPNQVVTGVGVTPVSILSGSGLSWTVSGSPQLVGPVTMTGTHTIPPGRSIIAGASVYSLKGWLQAASSEQLSLAADTVTPNTFYEANTILGLVKWTNCNPGVIVNTGNSSQIGWQFLGGIGNKLKAVPGEAGHLVYTPGPTGVPTGISNNGLFRTCNGNNSSPGGVDFTYKFPGVFGAGVVGFGKPRTGGSGYPSIYYWGWYDPSVSPTEANATFGLWESTDDPNHGNSGTGVSCISTGGPNNTGATFHQICTDGSRAAFGATCPNGANGSWPEALPGAGGWMTLFRDVTGDHDVYGPIYTSTTAGTFFRVLSQ